MRTALPLPQPVAQAGAQQGQAVHLQAWQHAVNSVGDCLKHAHHLCHMHASKHAVNSEGDCAKHAHHLCHMHASKQSFFSFVVTKTLLLYTAMRLFTQKYNSPFFCCFLKSIIVLFQLESFFRHSGKCLFTVNKITQTTPK